MKVDTASRPLKVSYGGIHTDIGKDFLHLVGQIDKNRSYDENRDATDFYDVNIYNVRTL